MLCQRNRSQLKLIFEEYQKLTGHEFEQAIKNEFSGTTKDILLALVECIRDKIGYLATRLHQSMEGIGTDDRVLIRIVVSRSEIDLGDIKDAFQRKYGKSLAEFVQVSLYKQNGRKRKFLTVRSALFYRMTHPGITRNVYLP